METKSFNLKFDSERGVFSGYASTFGNRDRDGDIIERGAFAEDLNQNGSQRVLLFMHDMRQPIGVIRLREDDIGLFAEAELNLEVAKVRDEIYPLAKQGALPAMSIGFVSSDFERMENGRVFKTAQLLEVSLVTVPANPRALVTSIKSLESAQTIRDVESGLRDLGLSKSQSQKVIGIITDKLKNKNIEMTEQKEQHEDVEIQNLIKQLKEKQNVN